MFFSGHGDSFQAFKVQGASLEFHPHLSPPPSRGRREMAVIIAPKEEEIICSGCELEDIIVYVGKECQGEEVASFKFQGAR